MMTSKFDITGVIWLGRKGAFSLRSGRVKVICNGLGEHSIFILKVRENTLFLIIMEVLITLVYI